MSLLRADDGRKNQPSGNPQQGKGGSRGGGPTGKPTPRPRPPKPKGK